MSKKILFFIAICLLVLMTGCSSSGSSNNNPVQSASPVFVNPITKQATINVKLAPRKPSGKAWDFDLSDNAPDIFIVVNGTSYYGSRCKNGYSCVFTVPIKTESLNIEVVDADAFGQHDSAGSTSCKIGETCRTESAVISVSEAQ
jgi:hypothetical protein